MNLCKIKIILITVIIKNIYHLTCLINMWIYKLARSYTQVDYMIYMCMHGSAQLLILNKLKSL